MSLQRVLSGAQRLPSSHDSKLLGFGLVQTRQSNKNLADVTRKYTQTDL